MSLTYTYWPAKEGGYIGCRNGHPDHLTGGETIGKLIKMLRDLRKDINEFIREGLWTESPCSVREMEFA